LNLRKLSDKDLLNNTKNLVSREREILTDVLHHLHEIQRRRLFSDLGYSSLFAYCQGELKYSEAETERRIEAMRLIAELPEIEQKVAMGELTLTNLGMARRHFRREEQIGPLGMQEKLQVLEQVANKSSRECEKILLAKASVPPAPVKDRMRQVTAEMTEIKFGADEKLLAKFKKLKGLMAHRKPNMNLAQFMDELCEIALAKLDPIRKAQQKMPKVIPSAPKVKKPKNWGNKRWINI
jgi:hypothetical protein